MASQFGVIHTYPQNPRVRMSLVAANYNGLAVKEEIVTMGKDNVSPGFLKDFPAGTVPAFRGSDGFCLSESSAILFYIASAKKGSTLVSNDPKEQSEINMWAFLAATSGFTVSDLVLCHMMSMNDEVERGKDAAMHRLKKVMNSLEHTLSKGKTYLVGNRVTVADISMFCCMNLPFTKLMTKECLQKFPHTLKWFQNLHTQPEFSKVVGKEFTFCTSPILPCTLTS